MLKVLLLLAATQLPEGDCPRGRCRLPGRSAARAPAYFEFAPASGAGMTAPCACTAPTGAKGETLTFSRASSGTCLKGSVSSIANGDMVTCSTNEPRVMPGGDGTGARGLLVEGARTNLALRSAELCNAAWSDVGTPSCASDAATGPLGTATMDSITDNDGAAYEGRSQLIATTSATVHSVSCFVKSSTATEASITLVGTGNGAGDCTGTATGLSTTTSTRVSCSSPAAYSAAVTAVTVTIRVGDAVGDQGVLYVEGCQHEVAAAFPSSYIATTSASATRAAEAPTFPLAAGTVNTAGSTAGTVINPMVPTSTGGMVTFAAANRPLRVDSNAGMGFSTRDGPNEVFRLGGCSAGTACRGYSFWSASTQTIGTPTGETSGTFDGDMMAGATAIEIGNNAGGGGALQGVIKQVCVDPSPSRCR